MNYLTVLNQTVTAQLDSGRIGTPVFVRWTAAVADSRDVLKVELAEMTVLASRWLAADLRQLYTNGTIAQGHLSLALQYSTGSSALIALTLAHDRPYENLAVYGNDGAMYHREYIVPIRDGSSSPKLAVPEGENGFNRDAKRILYAIERSLATRQPVELNQSGNRHE